MAQVTAKRVWHLSRPDERPCLVSDRELLLLAKLGRLRADDMLWGPDFDRYKTVRSLLGDVPAPKQIRVEATPPPSSAIETTTLYRMPTTALGSAKRRLNLIGVAGLLVAMALLAGLGLVTYRFLATDPGTATQDAAVTEPDPAPLKSQSASADFTSIPVQTPAPGAATANAESPSGSASHAEPKQRGAQGEVPVRTVKVIDIAPPRRPNARVSVTEPASEGRSDSVPPPIKRPASPTQNLSTAGEGLASSGGAGRNAESPMQSPMGLGPFGFSSGN